MILRRLPGSRFSEVLPGWAGMCCIIIGSGPSLTLAQIEHVRLARETGKVRVIAVNDAYLWAPFADAHHASDAHWHRWHSAGIAKPVLGLSAENVRKRWRMFAGEKCTIENSGGTVEDDAVHMLRNRDAERWPYHGSGVSIDPRTLITNRHSGAQAMNIATLAGAMELLLCGFDGGPSANGVTHFHGGHEPRPTPGNVWTDQCSALRVMAKAYRAMGVRVINCSPGSAVDAFEKMGLEDALALSCV